MSSKQCDSGSTSGFPINISNSIPSLLSNSSNKLQNLIVPTDFTLNWGYSILNGPITVRQTGTVCEITGFNTITDPTSIVYGGATYYCSNVLSIVANQHRNLKLNPGIDSQYEVILAFQIYNKQLHPSSPDIILLTRPIVLTSPGDPAAAETPEFWKTVDGLISSPTANNQVSNFDMSTIFAYSGGKVLMPMISYQTCLPVKLIKTSPAPSTAFGSLTMRVNVVLNPIFIEGTASGLGKCSSVINYTLVTSAGPLDIFNTLQSNNWTSIQFNVELDQTGPIFPIPSTTNLIPLKSSYSITSLTDILQKLEIVVPDQLLGKSIPEISNTTTLASSTPVSVNSTNTRYKCYTIDPKVDIVNGQIMIDPTTGQSLQDTLAVKRSQLSGGLTDLTAGLELPPSGILPGDVEQALVITAIIIFSLILVFYAGYIIYNTVYNEELTYKFLFHFLIFGGIIVFLVYLDKKLIKTAEDSKTS